MSTTLTDIVTDEGDLDLMDRTGGRVYLVISDESEVELDLGTMDLYLEVGTVSIALSNTGSDYYFDILPADCETIETNGWTRFVVIDKDPEPDEVVWEGLIFIRTVDS
jgi:hypothetical protein